MRARLLARQSFLTREKTVRRKLKEIVVAVQLEEEVQQEAHPRTLSEQGVLR